MTPGLFIWFKLFSVRPEIVDFGSAQGRSDFETAGVACHAVGAIEDFKRARTPVWAKRRYSWMGTLRS
jgi:hypothetical protein